MLVSVEAASAAIDGAQTPTQTREGDMTRRDLSMRLIAPTCLVLLAFGSASRAADYPSKPIELVVPASAGGGTDTLARAFSEAAKKHLPQPVIVVNKPGASGAIGMAEVLNAKPDGQKVGVIIAELAILPSLGQIKFTADGFRLIARLNADPSTVTVKADAPWNTVEEFLAEAKKRPGELKMGNSGNGSIWHLAAAALEDKTGTKFLHVPFQGAAPAVLALLGGHIDAVAVSPAEVYSYVASGKFKVLAVMSDDRVAGFEHVPTLKERNIDLSIGTWRGLAVPKNTPQDVVDVLSEATKKTAEEPGFRNSLAKINLGYAYADANAFKAAIDHDSELFKGLVGKLDLKN
jgi:tripartite-type tricarboxylate transporter receptor subunit TctC